MDRNEFIKKLKDLIRAEAPIDEAAIEELFPGQGRLPFSANVSRKTWVDDFLGLAQKDRSNQAIFHYLLERHGTHDWLAEYHVRLCNALCYMDEKMPEFEEAALRPRHHHAHTSAAISRGHCIRILPHATRP
jgi:hypothetical protein